MLKNEVWPEVEHRQDLRRIWFMQDGATCRTTDRVLSLLEIKCGDRIILRRSDILWPAQIPDLNLPNNWFWGYDIAEIRSIKHEDLQDFIIYVEIFCKNYNDSGSIGRYWEYC